MATNKKKKISEDALAAYNDERLVSKFDKQQTRPKIEKGSHLTVYTYSDGSTKLEWDDEALLQDVRQAILKVESTVPVTENEPKKIRKKKQK